MSETVLIIGASGGIGFELARQCLMAGSTVHGTTRTGAVPDGFASLPKQPVIHPLDVRKQAQIDALAESIGNDPVDVLFVATGVYDGASPSAGQRTSVDPEELYAINTEAPMAIAEAVYPNLKAAKKGRMIFLSSLEASRSMRPPLRTPYQHSKAALNDAVQHYAPVWAKDGVSGIALHPGWVETRIGGPNAPITPEHSAAGIRWIASEMGPEHNGGFYTYQGQRVPW
ncbi:MAG: SDR family NAD(P)-dependent oxidoreductase [Marinibacterium sp.]